MKYLLPLFLLTTACQTIQNTRPLPFFAQKPQASQQVAQQVDLKPEAWKIASPVRLPPKIETVEKPKVEKMEVTEKLPLEKLQSVKLEAATKEPMIEIKNQLTFRFPESKDDLTPYEKARLMVALKEKKGTLIITVAPDNSRNGFELLSAVKKRSDVISGYMQDLSKATITYAPTQEPNTVKIAF
jgi:hypothetical protein